MILSVIIPTRNRSKILFGTLESIAKQTLHSNLFEVIVVDNGSTDSTRDVVDSFIGKIQNLRYYYDESPGLHVGRHKGLKEAKTDIIVYADDDIETFPTWLEGIAEAFEDKDVMLVGGKTLPKFEAEPPDWIMKMWLQAHPEGNVLFSLSILDFGDSIKEINPYFVFGCNFSIRKSVILEASGFHPDAMPQVFIKYRGDGESYVWRYIMENGLKTLYCPKALIFHHVPKERMTLKYFYRRAYIQGISDSFTKTRKDHGLDINECMNKNERVEVRDNQTCYINMVKIYRLLRRGASSIKNRAVRYKKKIFSTEYNQIRIGMEKCHGEGFDYHRCEVQKDQKLLEWVLRKNYLGENGKLPE